VHVVVITLFPDCFPGPLGEGVVGRALGRGLLRLEARSPREWAVDRHGRVDDAPYGGGGGMLLRPEPLFEAVEALKREAPDERTRTILLSPQGTRLTQNAVRRLSRDWDRLVLICGRYEGVDERVRQSLVDEEISVGDYVLSGGELPAMILVEAVARILPGVLGRTESAERESFEEGCLEHPQYTRPPEYRGMRVPEVLRGGDHRAVEEWRRQAALEKTRQKRPDLLEEGEDRLESRPRPGERG
jgi:tRNA (guanine37-N1)-methyltransferase